MLFEEIELTQKKADQTIHFNVVLMEILQEIARRGGRGRGKF